MATGITFKTVTDTTTTNFEFLSTQVIGCDVRKYYPGKQEITLKNGNFVSFMPNEKIELSVEFAFISKGNLDLIVEGADEVWTINTSGASNFPSKVLFEDKKFLLQGTNLDYTFADRHLGAGFSGSLTFLETHD